MVIVEPYYYLGGPLRILLGYLCGFCHAHSKASACGGEERWSIASRVILNAVAPARGTRQRIAKVEGSTAKSPASYARWWEAHRTSPFLGSSVPLAFVGRM